MSDSESARTVLATRRLTVSSEQYKEVLGHFVTGVTVVTGMYAEQPAGFTCQSFGALSLDPALVFVSPSRVSTSWPRVAASGRFAVNILAHDQGQLARRFAVSGSDKFAGSPWSRGRASGAPLLAGTLGWVECQIVTSHEAGDHLVVIGRVLNLSAVAGGRPLTFFRGALSSDDGHRFDDVPRGVLQQQEHDWRSRGLSETSSETTCEPSEQMTRRG